MKFTVLVDNNTYIDAYYLGEPGLSYYIEDGDEKILFDLGYSDIVMMNAEKMHIDLDKVTKVVLSHGHNDHTGGLRAFFDTVCSAGKEIICHPEALLPKVDDDDSYIGAPFSKEELEKKCALNLTVKPVKVSENITFLGEIPVTQEFEQRYSIGKTGMGGFMMDDYLLDDSAIVYKSEEGLFIITGCSHSGICNIIEYAKKVCGDERICGVIGGFHLFDVNERLHKTIEYLKKNNIPYLFPCHCVSLDAKIAMGRELQIYEVGVGLDLNL